MIAAQGNPKDCRAHSTSYQDCFLPHITSASPTPLVFDSSLTATWRCYSVWVAPDGTPRLDGLNKYSNHLVQVADCSRRQFNEFERTERRLGDVADLWASDRPEGRSLYVKDWHLFLEIEEEGRSASEVYNTPDIFRDDWMSPHCLSLSPPSDFRFCYLGPAGTFTPFHRDVYASYSWSTNVVGRKRWLLVPPDEVHRFKGRNGMMFDLREMEEGDQRWDLIQEIVQEPMETIFVPSGWWHQVENLDFCISINHNFINSATILNSYDSLLVSLAACEESISDVKEMIKQRVGDGVVAHPSAEIISAWELEWLEEVQKLLERDAGWNFKGFWEMILHNMKSPAAPRTLRPSDMNVASLILPIVDAFKLRREWAVLETVRVLVDGVERLLSV